MDDAVIALLGQPNSGKSTLFNMLTGSRQHVGNWPGKTVEQKEGRFFHGSKTYCVADLPGTYSLSANSEEEIVTRDYIASGQADLVCILADTSQLERSLYMLADFAGINTPAILLLNMLDVAEDKGITVNTMALESRLGIPVLPFVAADKTDYERFYTAVEATLENPRTVSTEALVTLYNSMEVSNLYNQILDLIPPEGIAQYSATWLTVKILEGDTVVAEMVKNSLPADRQSTLDSMTGKTQDGSLITGNCKYRWIEGLLSDAVSQDKTARPVLTKFDRLATSSRWGKLIAIGMIILGLLASFIPATPVMFMGMGIQTLFSGTLSSLLERLGVSGFLVSLVADVLGNTLYMTVSMVGFVLGITLVFGLMEEVGYMARISYVFDDTMARFGLQGKSIMPFLVSVGCTIGGASSARVIDSWGQRMLTITLAWAVPCAATWAIVPTLSAIFFGWGAPLVIIAILGVMLLHMSITAKLFGKRLVPIDERNGMIMELPPYHKPKWNSLFRHVFNKTADIFWRALRVIFLVSVLFWALSYSSSGNVEDSLIYTVGIFIEPVTRFFGLGWQTFMAFISAAISKEAALGVLSALYTGSGSVFDATMGIAVTSGNLAEVLAVSISRPEALAFIFAVTFNVPCLTAVASTYQESHSMKWTLCIAGYYIFTALLLCMVIYRIGGLIL